MKVMISAAILAAVCGWGAAKADSLSGAYLAGKVSERNHDYALAAEYFSRAVMLAPRRPDLMRSLVLTQILSGRVEQATSISSDLHEQGQGGQVAQMALTVDYAKRGQYAELLELSSGNTGGIGPLVEGLVQAWAHLGLGDRDAAMAGFDALAQEDGLAGFASYHKALALASLGDFEAAEDVLSSDIEGISQMTRRGAMAYAEILSQLGRNEDALASLDTVFGTASDPGLLAMREALEGGETLPFTHITSVTDGVAEVFFSLATALRTEAQPSFSLLYTRIAQALRPDHTDALLLSAELLAEVGQQELAIEVFEAVPRGHVDYHAAELGRVRALRDLERYDAAIEVLKTLAQSHGHLAIVHSNLGDIYRLVNDYESAEDAYERALERSPEDSRGRWFLYYARGITRERQDLWDLAEADFRASLAIEPDQAQVLNYLGYSLVEKRMKLDEALDMIERAVASRPDSGYIVDSLGWVLYRLGRYEEAVGHMERAVELMPVDPVVNDHLGDVYWAVGRYREAEFQWSRALSFVDVTDPDNEADPERIRRKMEVGLYQVLEEEGAEPLHLANDNN